MKIIRTLALAGTLAGGSILTGCSNPTGESINQVGESLKNTGFTTEEIEEIRGKAVNLNSWYAKPTFIDLGEKFRYVADSAIYSRKMESAKAVWQLHTALAVDLAKELGKQAAIDSLEKAGKLIK